MVGRNDGAIRAGDTCSIGQLSGTRPCSVHVTAVASMGPIAPPRRAVQPTDKAGIHDGASRAGAGPETSTWGRQRRAVTEQWEHARTGEPEVGARPPHGQNRTQTSSEGLAWAPRIGARIDRMMEEAAPGADWSQEGSRIRTSQSRTTGGSELPGEGESAGAGESTPQVSSGIEALAERGLAGGTPAAGASGGPEACGPETGDCIVSQTHGGNGEGGSLGREVAAEATDTPSAQCAGGGHSSHGAPSPGVVDTSPEGPSPPIYGFFLDQCVECDGDVLEPPQPAAPCTSAGPPHVPSSRHKSGAPSAIEPQCARGGRFDRDDFDATATNCPPLPAHCCPPRALS